MYRVFILLFVGIVLAKVSSALPIFSVKTVVIDAGHGGKDPGAIGLNKTYEKNVALAVALDLGNQIKTSFPDVKVIYTRSTDVFIPLVERANIANHNKADLFISIHCNSAENRTAYGSSTYVLGLHKTEENLDVAKRENAVIELEDNVDKNYDFNPNSPEGHIIMSMKQNVFLEQSIDIAARIENELEGNNAAQKSRGVKQAGFFVLYKTSMPALLAEIGFISNPKEETYLASKVGQQAIAKGIFNAFSSYKSSIENSGKHSIVSNGTIKKSTKQEVEVSTIVQSNTPPKKATEEEEKTQAAPAQPKLAEAIKPATTSNGTASKQASAPMPTASKGTAPPKTDETIQTVKQDAGTAPKPIVQSGYEFYLQLFASSKTLAAYPKLKDTFGNIKVEALPNGINRFMAGSFSSYQEAEQLKAKAATNGFPDTFVVAYKNGTRLDMNAARALKK